MDAFSVRQMFSMLPMLQAGGNISQSDTNTLLAFITGTLFNDDSSGLPEFNGIPAGLNEIRAAATETADSKPPEKFDTQLSSDIDGLVDKYDTLSTNLDKMLDRKANNSTITAQNFCTVINSVVPGSNTHMRGGDAWYMVNGVAIDANNDTSYKYLKRNNMLLTDEQFDRLKTRYPSLYVKAENFKEGTKLANQAASSLTFILNDVTEKIDAANEQIAAGAKAPESLGKLKELRNKICQVIAPGGEASSSSDPMSPSASASASASASSSHRKILQSPIILDSGNGTIDLTSAKDGVMFDIDGDGNKEQVAWSKADGDNTDGWLAMLDANGQITSGRQLFGNNTIVNGKTFGNGFEALKQFDSNNDGVMDGQDAAFSKLRIWKDKNHNGVADAGELKTLNQSEIKNILLNYEDRVEVDAFGNEIRQHSAFTRTDGSTGQADDAWLNIQQ